MTVSSNTQDHNPVSSRKVVSHGHGLGTCGAFAEEGRKRRKHDFALNDGVARLEAGNGTRRARAPLTRKVIGRRIALGAGEEPPLSTLIQKIAMSS